MIHLTLNTGDSRVSPRGEVQDDIVDLLRPLVRAGGGPLPHPPGYSVTITREGRDAVFTVSATMDPGGGPYPVPLVSCGLAIEDGPRVWDAITRGNPGLGLPRAGLPPMPATLPWLAVVIHEPALLAVEALSWLGDAERCLAWTIIEEDRRVQ